MTSVYHGRTARPRSGRAKPRPGARFVTISSSVAMTNGMACRRTPQAGLIDRHRRGAKGQSVEPTNRKPRLLQRHPNAASVFGTCS
jgi:hypothetical protein